MLIVVVKVAVCRAGTAPPAQHPPRTAAAARSLLPPTSPFDAVPAGPTGLNRQTGLFAEVTHLRRERVACFRVLSAISSRVCVRVRVWCHATGRSRRLKITTPSCARWRWNRHCAITPTSRRICTASFSDGAVGFFFPFFSYQRSLYISQRANLFNQMAGNRSAALLK